jgi:hypothetical protein
MEPVILAYAYGKPKEQVEIAVNPRLKELSELSLDELAARAEALAERLRDASAAEAFIGADYVVRGEAVRPLGLEAGRSADSREARSDDEAEAEPSLDIH